MLDQNRLYAGIGRWLDERKRWRLETGYVYQSTWQSDESVEGRKRINHTLRVTLVSEAPFRD